MSNHPSLGWGHININVSDLDASIGFYETLGFSVFLPGIPYLGLAKDAPSELHSSMAVALGIPGNTNARACIMQLDDGFPKLDLTEVHVDDPRHPLSNSDTGVVRICLTSTDLKSDVDRLRSNGVEFISDVQSGYGDLADIAVCRDPDGTLIEIIQVYLERWQKLLS